VSGAGSTRLDLSAPNSNIVMVLQPQAPGMNPHARDASWVEGLLGRSIEIPSETRDSTVQSNFPSECY